MSNWIKNTFIEVSVPVLVDRHEVPKMSESEELAFKRELSDILGAWIPTNDEWLEAVNLALKNAGLDSIYQQS